MSIEVDRLQAVKIQTEGTFGTAPANWASAYDVRVRGRATLRRMVDMLEDETIQQYPDARPDSWPGFARCALSLPVYFDSTGLLMTGSQAWATYWLAVILQHVMGGLDARSNMGSTAAAGWTTSAGSVASGANLRRGGYFAVQPTGSALYQMRRAANLVTNALTANIALSAAPAENDVIYGCPTAYMADNPTATLQALCLGKEAQDQFRAFGLASAGMKIIAERNKLAGIDFEFMGCAWDDTSGEAFVEPTYGGGDRVAVKGAELFVVPANQAQARVGLDVADIRIEPNIVYEEDETTAGINGIASYRRIPVRPLVKGSFLTTFQDQAWNAARIAKTAQQLLFQLGNTPAHTPAVDVSKIQIMDVEDPPKGRKRGQRVSFASDIDRVTTWAATATELERSGLRIPLG